MSEETMNGNEVEVNYDDEDGSSINRSDKNASRVTEGGAYLGEFTRAEHFVTDKGATGVELEFETGEGGKVVTKVYTIGKTGQKTFGWDQIQGLKFLLGVKTMKGTAGTVHQWVDGERGRELVEVPGIVFPELCGKKIGIIFEKELTGSKGDNGDRFRFNLYGAFDATSKLTASEIKDRKAKPEKVEKMLKGLKTRDGRKAEAVEPAQPGIGVDGGY